jgi:hypothetical protein
MMSGGQPTARQTTQWTKGDLAAVAALRQSMQVQFQQRHGQQTQDLHCGRLMMAGDDEDFGAFGGLIGGLLVTGAVVSN